MKTKLLKLKESILPYQTHLEKKIPMTKLILSSIDRFIAQNADDEHLVHWYRSMGRFIREIEREIKRLENE